MDDKLKVTFNDGKQEVIIDITFQGDTATIEIDIPKSTSNKNTMALTYANMFLNMFKQD